MKVEFENTVVFDSKNKIWKPIDWVIIKNGIIEEIQYSKKHELIRNYIIPGLIDSHIHIAEESDYSKLKNYSLEEDIETTITRVKYNSNLALNKSITSIIDFGFYRETSLIIKEQIQYIEKTNCFKFPNFITSGTMLSKSNGHAPDRALIVDSISVEDKIRYLIDSGIEVIKILNDPIVFSKDEVKKITKLAHQNNLKVSMHLYTDEAANLALDSDVDCFQHAGDFSDATLKRIASSDVIVVPTFIAALDTLINPQLTLPEDHFSDISLDICKQWFKAECKILKKLYLNGIKIACGSDACFPGTPADSLIREMISWNYFEIPVKDIIQSATYHSALTVNKESFLGQFKSGYSADFIMYDENPEHNINVLKKPSQIWLRGKNIFYGDNKKN